MFRLIIGVSLAALSIIASPPTVADPEEDAGWVAQCVNDNKKEGQDVKTVVIYCDCMNDMMPESETRSITEWEKTHRKEEEICSRKAGWR